MRKISRTRITVRRRDWLIVRRGEVKIEENSAVIVCPECQTPLADVICALEDLSEQPEVSAAEGFSSNR